MPVFEAVQNSIHAIEDRGDEGGSVVVEILRNPQASTLTDKPRRRGPDSQPEIVGFRIVDDGIGFTDENMSSFETLDSDWKAARGGRGVGRLLWLKAFQQARVRSIYVADDGKHKVRAFSFTAANGVMPGADNGTEVEEPPATTVTLYGFNEKYRKSARKTADAIANQLFEHCLWYFVRDGGAPRLLVKDGDATVRLDSVYEEHMYTSADREELVLRGHSFDLLHIKLTAAANQSHAIAWCAANRLVKEEPIAARIPGLFGKLGDGDGFSYVCYVSSDYLDERVRPERTDFALETASSNGLLDDTELSARDLEAGVVERIKSYLDEYLAPKRAAGLKRVRDFVAQKKPAYRPLLPYIPKEELLVDPAISDSELDVFLHRHRSRKEQELLEEGHRILQPDGTDDPRTYGAKVQDYLKLADDIKKSDLAEYVTHRRVILDLLRTSLKRNPEGRYEREDLIHELIMPMRKTSDSIEFERNNLWLIDERLAFHNFLASDRTLASMPITGSESGKEPDILVLNAYDSPVLVAEGETMPLGSIVIVELKRPMRNDARPGAEHDPIEQTLEYLEKVRAGGVQTVDGRPIPNAPEIPGFCYVICDLTPKMHTRCRVHGLTVTHDQLGYFGYNMPYKAYIEVLSFDRLLKGSTERNRAFFDSLGLPA